MVNLIIKTAELKSTKKTEKFIESYSCPAISDLCSTQDINIHYVAELLGSEVLLTGAIRGALELECSKCLDKFKYTIDIGITQSYPDSMHEIDINEEIKELLVLEVPSVPVCRESCLGMCPECGSNRNSLRCTCEHKPHDPRWEKLRLRPKK